MTVSKLSLYQGALLNLSIERLSAIDEDIEPRHAMDDVWDNQLRDRVLQKGQWNFATRSVKLESSTSTTPTFGYQYAFDKASDFIRTLAVCQDEYFDIPLTRYTDEASWWFADMDPIYVRYVSNDSSYGYDYSIWPPNFSEWVEHYMAYKAGGRLKGQFDTDALDKKQKAALLDARGTDAMESPALFPPLGSWSNSRVGWRSGGRADRGSRRRLIG